MIDGAITRIISSVGAELVLSEAGDPGRPTIIFVHGYPDTKEVWDGVLGRLAGRFHVVAYDVRGAGASSAPRGPSAYSFERLADDLEAVSRAHPAVGSTWSATTGVGSRAGSSPPRRDSTGRWRRSPASLVPPWIN